jgi:hypothetical protein
VSAALLLSRCWEQGIDLSAGPNGTLQWECDGDPSADLLVELAKHKVEVLALLSWDQGEADRLIEDIEARRTALFGPGGWPEDPALCARLAELADTIDQEMLAQNLPGLRRATEAYLDFLAPIWDARAEQELNEALSLLGTGREYTLRPGRLNLLAEYEMVIRAYHAQRNPLIFQARAAVAGLLQRWREADSGSPPETDDWIPEAAGADPVKSPAQNFPATP